MPEIPEWVQVWTWLRFLRAPRIWVPLPQQEPDPNAMSEERYYELRDEWLEAGLPKLSATQVVAAMGAAVALESDEDIPFDRLAPTDDIPF